MAKRSRVITMSPLILDQVDDLELDLWEVVNLSDGEYSDDSFSVNSLSDDEVISLEDASLNSPSVISPSPQMLTEDDGGADLELDGHVDGDDVFRDKVDDIGLGWAQKRIIFLGGGSHCSVGITYGDGVVDDSDEDRDGDYDDSYDLDDELVPRNVSRKLGRQRMRKLGKRGIAKVLTSKTSPYSHLKPGCLRGKHGLGLKFRC